MRNGLFSKRTVHFALRNDLFSKRTVHFELGLIGDPGGSLG
jgi:hypothetical protein